MKVAVGAAGSGFTSGVDLPETLDDAIIEGFIAIACALLIAPALPVKHCTSEV